MRHFFLFYKDLFASCGNTIEWQKDRELCRSLNPKRISKEHVEVLIKEVSKEEIINAIKVFKNAKYPREDEYPIELQNEN